MKGKLIFFSWNMSTGHKFPDIFKNYVAITVELFNLSNTNIMFIFLFLQSIHKYEMMILVIKKKPIPQFF